MLSLTAAVVCVDFYIHLKLRRAHNEGIKTEVVTQLGETRARVCKNLGSLVTLMLKLLHKFTRLMALRQHVKA
jgi:hypothetical protein